MRTPRGPHPLWGHWVGPQQALGPLLATLAAWASRWRSLTRCCPEDLALPGAGVPGALLLWGEDRGRARVSHLLPRTLCPPRACGFHPEAPRAPGVHGCSAPGSKPFEGKWDSSELRVCDRRAGPAGPRCPSLP